MAITKYCFVDVETTGTDERIHGLTQIAGSIDFLENGVLVTKDTFNYRLKPYPGDKIDPKALEVTNLTMEQIEKYPDPNDIFKEFHELLEKHVRQFDRSDKMQLVAYNGGFDDKFLRAFWEKNNDKYYGSFFSWPVMDVAQGARWDLEEGERGKLENFKLATVAKYYGVEATGDLHDAEVDIELTKKLFLKIKKMPYITGN